MVAGDPPYCEAYPRLSGADMVRASFDDHSLCRFATRHGEERGWLEILGSHALGEVARWKLRGPGVDPHVGRHVIPYCYESGQRGRPSPFTCQGCKRRVGNLVFTTTWKCRRCHGLRYRSTYLDRSVRDAERNFTRWEDLKRQIGSGRPPGMWQTTYRMLKAELRRVETSWDLQVHLTANTDRQTVVMSEWMSSETAWKEHGFDPASYFDDD